jgi:hypothetical protein
MRTAIITFIFGLLWIRCSSTSHVPVDPAAKEFIEAHERLHLEEAIVTLIDGTEISLDSTVLQAAHVVGVETETRFRQEYPLVRVRDIRMKSTGRGAIRGVLIGSILGGAAGLAAGISSRGEWLGPRSTGDVLAWGGVFALIGGLEGALVGSIAGLTEYYSFPTDTLVSPIAPAITPKPPVKLRMTILPEETQDAVRIVWNGRDIWLKKSAIKIERRDDGIWLTIPGHLLQ